MHHDFLYLRLYTSRHLQWIPESLHVALVPATRLQPVSYRCCHVTQFERCTQTETGAHKTCCQTKDWSFLEPAHNVSSCHGGRCPCFQMAYSLDYLGRSPVNLCSTSG